MFAPPSPATTIGGSPTSSARRLAALPNSAERAGGAGGKRSYVTTASTRMVDKRSSTDPPMDKTALTTASNAAVEDGRIPGAMFADNAVDVCEPERANFSMVIAKQVLDGGDWRRKVGVLRQLEDELGAGTMDAGEPGELLPFMESLAALLRDLKDARPEIPGAPRVTQLAAGVVAALARSLGARFCVSAAAIIPELLPFLSTPREAVQEAVSASVTAMLVACHSPGVLRAATVPLVGSKKAHLRRKGSAFLCVAIERWPEASLKRTLPPIMGQMRKALFDADATVRREGRQTFGVFIRLWPAEGGGMYHALDRANQRAVLQEQPHVSNFISGKAVPNAAGGGAAGAAVTSSNLASTAPASTASRIVMAAGGGGGGQRPAGVTQAQQRNLLQWKLEKDKEREKLKAQQLMEQRCGDVSSGNNTPTKVARQRAATNISDVCSATNVSGGGEGSGTGGAVATGVKVMAGTDTGIRSPRGSAPGSMGSLSGTSSTACSESLRRAARLTLRKHDLMSPTLKRLLKESAEGLQASGSGSSAGRVGSSVGTSESNVFFGQGNGDKGNGNDNSGDMEKVKEKLGEVSVLPEVADSPLLSSPESEGSVAGGGVSDGTDGNSVTVTPAELRQSMAGDNETEGLVGVASSPVVVGDGVDDIRFHVSSCSSSGSCISSSGSNDGDSSPRSNDDGTHGGAGGVFVDESLPTRVLFAGDDIQEGSSVGVDDSNVTMTHSSVPATQQEEGVTGARYGASYQHARVASAHITKECLKTTEQFVPTAVDTPQVRGGGILTVSAVAAGRGRIFSDHRPTNTATKRRVRFNTLEEEDLRRQHDQQQAGGLLSAASLNSPCRRTDSLSAASDWWGAGSTREDSSDRQAGEESAVRPSWLAFLLLLLASAGVVGALSLVLLGQGYEDSLNRSAAPSGARPNPPPPPKQHRQQQQQSFPASLLRWFVDEESPAPGLWSTAVSSAERNSEVLPSHEEAPNLEGDGSLFALAVEEGVRYPEDAVERTSLGTGKDSSGNKEECIDEMHHLPEKTTTTRTTTVDNNVEQQQQAEMEGEKGQGDQVVDIGDTGLCDTITPMTQTVVADVDYIVDEKHNHGGVERARDGGLMGDDVNVDTDSVASEAKAKVGPKPKVEPKPKVSVSVEHGDAGFDAARHFDHDHDNIASSDKPLQTQQRQQQSSYRATREFATAPANAAAFTTTTSGMVLGSPSGPAATFSSASSTSSRSVQQQQSSYSALGVNSAAGWGWVEVWAAVIGAVALLVGVVWVSKGSYGGEASEYLQDDGPSTPLAGRIGGVGASAGGRVGADGTELGIYTTVEMVKKGDTPATLRSVKRSRRISSGQKRPNSSTLVLDLGSTPVDLTTA